MKKIIKPVFLFLALLLPVCIFTFLKIFGNNQFDIPLYYQTEEELLEIKTACDNIDIPYTLNFERFDVFESTANIPVLDNQITVVAYILNPDNNHVFSMLSLKERLGDTFQMIIFSDNFSNDIIKNQNFISFKVGDNAKNFWHCGLLSNEYEKWVLIDSKRRIRGYYEVTEEEIDRLIVEIKILLENEHV